MDVVTFKRCFFVVAVASVMVCRQGVLAQNDALQDQETGDFLLEEVVVTGIRGSLLRALDEKNSSQQFSDSISAEDLGKFPDLNLSESLQRIPGVTLNRNPNGEGEAINLRGLAPQFTRVEINGLTALGNGADQNINGRLGGNGGGREFNFELLPAELFSRASVIKSARASQSEGGLAGVVELETPKPLDHKGFKFVASGQGNYSDTTETTDPRTFITVSNNYDDVFGISASLAYSEGSFRSDSIESGTWHRLADITNNVAQNDPLADALVARTPRVFSFLEERENIATTMDIQFRPTEDIVVSFGSLYAELTNEKNAVRPDMVLEGGAVAAVLNDPLNPLVVSDGKVVRGTFEGVQYRPSSRLVDIDDKFYQLSVGMDFTGFDNWVISPYIGYSNRKADREHSLLSFRANDVNGNVRQGPDAYLTYQLDGDYLNFSSPLTDLRSNPQDFTLNVLIFRPTVDEDEELTTKLDFSKNVEQGSLTNINFGMRYSDRTKTVTAQEYRLRRDVLPNQIPGFDAVDMLVDFDVDGSSDPYSGGKIFTVDPDKYLSVYFPDGFNGVNSNTIAGTSIDNRPGRGASRSYEVEEETLNLYIDGDFDIGAASVNVGIRLVRTEQTSTGSIVENQDQPSERIIPVSIENAYTEFLPSASLRYELKQNLLLRAAYSKTLTRANIPDLSPAETIFVPDATTLGSGKRGNPELKPFTADNLDFGAEWYFQEEALLAANVFYKRINNLIGSEISTEIRTFLPQVGTSLVTGPVAFTVPTNAASASIRGFEFSYQQPFTTFAEGILQDFGFLFNYTYADSTADFGLENDVRSDGLPGLSSNSFNTSLYYDNGSLDARLSYAWRERYLAAFSDDFALPRFVDDFGQFDLSVNYSVGDNLQLQLQVLNVTDENLISQSYDQTAGFLPYGVLDLNRRLIFGVRYIY